MTKSIKTMTDELVKLLSNKTLSFGYILGIYISSLADRPQLNKIFYLQKLDNEYHLGIDLYPANSVSGKHRIIEFEDEQIYEHYGHQVTLARVLYMAKDFVGNDSLCIDSDGSIGRYIFQGTFTDWGIDCSWNLEKDDLTQQSPKIIKYLHNLFLIYG